MNAGIMARLTGVFTLEQMEEATFDERHTAEFTGELSKWWTEFWHSYHGQEVEA